MRAQVVSCIEAGQPLLLENLPEDVDAVLDPVIGKLVIKRGRATILKLGEAEVEYNPNFRCRGRLPADFSQIIMMFALCAPCLFSRTGSEKLCT